MEFESVIRNRRSIRKFKPNQIETVVIEQLIECARLCQSAKNRQPWKFMVLKDDSKNNIADIMLGYFDQKKSNSYNNSSRSSANIIKQAPVLFLIFQDFDENWQIGDLLSIGAAIEHICLEAVNLGLGSVWIRDTVYTEDLIAQSVGYPELKLVSAIAIGIPAETPNARPRKSTTEIMLEKRLPAIIKTERCILNPINIDDFDAVLPLYTDDEHRTYLGGPILKEQALLKLKLFMNKSDELHLAVKLLDGTFIGLIEITKYHNQIDTEISYTFLKQFWGNGYAYETMKAVLHYCQNKLNLNHIVIETQTKNIRSNRLIEKLDGKLEQKLMRFNEEQNLYVIVFQ